MYVTWPALIVGWVVLHPDSAPFVGFAKVPAVVVPKVESFTLNNSIVFCPCAEVPLLPGAPAGPVGPANEKLPAKDKAPELAVYFKWFVASPKKKLPLVSKKNPLSLSVNDVLFGVLKVPPLASVIVLPTLKLFVSVVSAVSLEALSVPSTITLPSKVSTTKELKSAASASDAVPVAAAV